MVMKQANKGNKKGEVIMTWRGVIEVNFRRAMLDILDVWRDMTGRAPVTRRPPLARSDILSRKAEPKSQRIACFVRRCCSTALPSAACSSCELLELSFATLRVQLLLHQRDDELRQNTRGRASLVVDGLSHAITNHCSCLRRPRSTRREEKYRLNI